MEPKPNEARLTQYMPPNGKQKEAFCDVGEELAAQSRGMILSAEILMTGKVALYGRWEWQDDEDELCEIADNGPGERSPVVMMKRLISNLWAERNPHMKPGGD